MRHTGVKITLLLHCLTLLLQRSMGSEFRRVRYRSSYADRVRNFEKFRVNNMDMPYDYGSIMHFGRYAYSEDGDPTIVPKQSWNNKLGQIFGPSELDVMKINKLYKCT
ncbi:Embryonic protein UVS.2 [Bagarius yarrelli]|uniref:Metalloendopeptidase n=1 Tax=Bagarius yarrelli TaxID=175774 RepID=A0A556V1G0_BAGYA|nr:Embryonic protein UVS.2 [Bagarius yarrelli]